MNETLDPQIVNLAKAIRQTESQGNFQAKGKSGEYGAYQFMPSTWASAAPKFGVNVPLQQATPQQQNEVAYKQLAEWKQQHPEWNVGNFASAWNAGPGKPDAYIQHNVGTNSQGVNYDTPAYAKSVAEAYQSIKAGTQTTPQATLATSATPAQEAPPSVGGFAHNVLTSGAGLLANVGEAILHPIQTVQNIGGAAVGGLQELAGQATENTAKFDNLVNFFKDRYGSIDNLEKTLYHDPVGVAADISTVFGGAGLVARGAGLAAKAGGAAEATGALSKAGSALGRASELTNPLTPIATGIGKVANMGVDAGSTAIGKFAKFEPATVESIRANPDAFTPEQIASVTREAVGTEVATALNKRITALNEAGAEYSAIREVPVNGSFSAETLIPVAHNFMEEQLRSIAGLEVKDGKIVANGNSTVRNAADINKLQQKFDLWKPVFQKGVLTPNEFLNFRSDMADLARFGIGEVKSTPLQSASAGIRAKLNEEYRGKIPGLSELDERFSKEQSQLIALRKGLINREGKLNDTAYNLIANATNKGNAERLRRLEQIVPGITEKLKVLKAIEDIHASMGNKVGTYGTSIAEAGGVIGGLATGHLGVAAAAITAMIISEPSRAVQLIRAAEKLDPTIIPMVLSRLSRYATIGAEGNRATSGQESGQTGNTEIQSQEPNSPSDPNAPSLSPGDIQPPQPKSDTTHSLDELAKANNFDLQAAREAGYSDEEIQSFLATVR